MRLFSKWLVITALAASLAGFARADVGTVRLDTFNQKVLNAVNAPSTVVVGNVGLSFHVLCYVNTSANNQFQLRLEESFDGVNYSPLSDDATSNLSGCVYGQGSYPFVRVNLVFFSGSGTITAYYTGAFTGSVPPSGVMNQSQMFRKVIGYGVGASNVTYPITPPCANVSGLFYFQYLSNPGSGGSMIITPAMDTLAVNTANGQSFTFANTSAAQFFQVPPNPATLANVAISTSTVTGSTYAASYIFSCPPGSGGGGTGAAIVAGVLQPSTYAYSNSETVSATNTAATVTLTGAAGQIVSVFSVSARCSAGSAQLTINTGATLSTQIWSTAATEVGTTTFRFQWSPGLASSLGNGLKIVLSACGSGDVGTLDIQASYN
jgi:hypothetical protein